MEDNPLDKCLLVEFLRIHATSTALSDDDIAQIEEAYREFLSLVVDLSKKELSAIKYLRYLVVTRITLELIRRRSFSVYAAVQLFYTDAAIEYLEFEYKMSLLKLQYPNLENSAPESFQSPLFWSKEYSHADLMELISAIHELGVIRKMDGSAAELTMLIRMFEKMFNCKIRNPTRCRSATLNRKIRLTRFIDRLKGALINRSQL